VTRLDFFGGVIQANGGDGGDATSPGTGGGGGAAGGIFLHAFDVNLDQETFLLASGGDGGTWGGGCGGGGHVLVTTNTAADFANFGDVDVAGGIGCHAGIYEVTSATNIGAPPAPVHVGAFDPNDFASLGALPDGSFTIDTTEMTFAGIPGGAVQQQAVGVPEVAVFTFDGGSTLDSDATITVTGRRALALLFQGDVTINGTIDASGSDGQDGTQTSGGGAGRAVAGGFHGGSSGYCTSPHDGRGPGGGENGGANANAYFGSFRAGGGGGAFGGDGGNGRDSTGFKTPLGGDRYSNLQTHLEGGSGGGGGGVFCAGPPLTRVGGGGGAGGGGVEIGALTNLTLAGAVIRANGGAGGGGIETGGGGGAGGGILLHAFNVDLDPSTALEARGGDAGRRSPGSPSAGCGGGGHVVALTNTAGQFSNLGTIDVRAGLSAIGLRCSDPGHPAFDPATAGIFENASAPNVGLPPVAPNQPPVARDDDVTTDEDTATVIDVLADNGYGPDSDPDGNIDVSQTVNLTSATAGVLTNNHDGTFAFDPDDDFQALAAGEQATVSFDYRIEDTFGQTDTATVRITVTGVNDTPVANPDTGNTNENAAVTVDVLANDTDVDSDDNPSNFSLDSVSIAATTGLSGSPAAAGAVSIVGNQVRFDPGGDFDELDASDTSSVTVNYTMSDGSGSASSSTLRITITGQNDAPVANPDTGNTNENAAVTVDVLANDTDVDSDDNPSNFSLDSVSIAATIGLNGSPAAAGAVRIVGNQVRFDPRVDFDELAVGETATVTIGYTMSDDGGAASSATATITVIGLNDDPSITGTRSTNDTPCSSAAVGVPVEIVGTFFDVDISDSHTATADWADGGDPEPITVRERELSQTGTFLGSHAYGAGGIYQITVTIDDGHGASDTITTTAVITGVGLVDGTLYVIGTPDADHVTVNKQGNGLLKVHADFLPGKKFRTFNVAGVDRSIAYLCSGDDRMTIAGNVAIPAIMHGNEGSDHLNGGGGPSVLLGGAGADMLVGGSGRNILIGVIDADRLVGGTGDDVLIGGSSSDDDEDDALLAALAAWNSEDSYDDRVAVIDALFTLQDDGDEDKLTGGSGRDVFFDGLGDLLTDLKTRKKPETVL